MLCRKFKQILYNKFNWNNNLQHFLISTRLSKKCVSVDGFWAVYRSDIKAMSSIRFVLKDLSIMRLWSAWRRSYFVSTVVRRCRKDRGVRDVIQRFRHSLLRPRQTLLLSATAAYKTHREESESPPSCETNITDEELQALLQELENVSNLSRNTLFCTSCGRRLVIDKKLSGVSYCSCKECKSAEDLSEGWEPYMEAEDVIVWRKQYKPGQPYYAYKVYGRYKELRAQDFAAVQVDGAYRRVWDAAVASLSVVERKANGVDDQTVLHWEVLWPRLFANRDYVYIRRHKEFDIERSAAVSLASPLPAPTPAQTPAVRDTQRPSVHSHAKRKAMEKAQMESDRIMEESATSNKVYIIASRSCEHSTVPESKHAIRVADFWSHMVIKTLDGPDQPGMEFVLTYYEEPAVGGLPSGVATWATGRAAPAFLERQRRAAAEYRTWRATRTHQDLPDYIPFGPETEATLDSNVKVAIREQDMESSKQGPELESETEITTHDQSTQTDIELRTTMIAKVAAQDASVATDSILYATETSAEKEPKKLEESSKSLESERENLIDVKDAEVKHERNIVIENDNDKVGLKQDGDTETQNGRQDSRHSEKEGHETRNDKNESQIGEQGIGNDDKEKSYGDKEIRNSKNDVQNGKETMQDGGIQKGDGDKDMQDGGKEKLDGGVENKDGGIVKQDGDKLKQDGGKETKQGVKETKDGGKEKQDGGKEKQDGDVEEENKKNGSWWRYLYPFYYFA